MTIHRYSAKRDANEKPIRQALQAVGAEVVQLSGKNIPDLLCAFRHKLYLFEVKMPKTGRVSEGQKEFHEAWYGLVHVVRTPEEALHIIGAIVEDGNG